MSDYMEKISDFGGGDSQTSKLATTNSNAIAKADIENTYTSVGNVPRQCENSIKGII
jgi:hypothetical protein